MSARNSSAARALRSIAKSFDLLAGTFYNEVRADEVKIEMFLLAKFPDPATRPRLRYETLRSDYWAPKDHQPAEQSKGYDTQVARYFRGGTDVTGSQGSRPKSKRNG